jgi:short-subunit dehydrogenase
MSSENESCRVLVTGASSGIGAELARVFAREHRDLVLVARSRERLEALAGELQEKHGVRVRTIASDLAVPGAAERIHRALAEEGIAVDVLVNNAGFGMRGAFVELDSRRQMEMVSVNLIALTELCRLFAPEMVKRGAGKILNVASTGAFAPGPLMAVYCATKAYVLSFSEALANELRQSGVTVTCLCPGPTETQFAERAGTSKTKLFRSGVMSSAAVAEAGRKALARGADLVIPGFSNRAIVASTRFVSVRAVAGMTRRFLEEP